MIIANRPWGGQAQRNPRAEGAMDGTKAKHGFICASRPLPRRAVDGASGPHPKSRSPMNLTMPYELSDYKHPISRVGLQILNTAIARVAQIVHAGEKLPKKTTFLLTVQHLVLYTIVPHKIEYTAGKRFQQFIPRMPTAPPRWKVLKKWPVDGFCTGDEARMVSFSRIGRASARRLSPLIGTTLTKEQRQ